MKERFFADLHTHLNEKKIKPKDWWKSVEEKNLCAVAITEHSYCKPKKAFDKLKKTKPKKIILVPGVEANTNAGHLLIYGEDEKIFDYKELFRNNVDIEDALKIVKEKNLVATFAHPFGYKTDSVCSIIGEKKTINLIKKYDIGVEYYNGMLGSANNFIFGTQWVKKLYNFFDFTSKNPFTKKIGLSKKSENIKNKLEKISEETFERVKKGIFFSEKAKYITVGSDAHYPRVIGTAIIEFKRKPKNVKDVLKMIRKKEVVWAGPNIYSKEPVDKLKKKELLEGLKYVTKKKLKRKKRSEK